MNVTHRLFDNPSNHSHSNVSSDCPNLVPEGEIILAHLYATRTIPIALTLV